MGKGLNRICLIYNFAQHYRSNIFMLMDKELSIDFVFGNKYLDINKMDYTLLNNLKKEVKNKTFIRKPFTFQTGVITLINDYKTFIILGDLHSTSTWLMLVLAKLYNKKVYLWSHGWYGKESKMKAFIKKIFFGLAQGTFLYGNYARNLMIKEGINSNKLFVIYNSLNYDEQILLREKLIGTKQFQNHFNNNHKNLIFIGRLTGQKRLDMLINALSKLKNIDQHFNLTIVGAGEKEFELKELTYNLGLEKTIWFYGPCYDEKILAELIYNADLCVSPGNVGLTAIHAMTYGTPVLTHNNFPYQMPEFEAIVEGETGLFFEYENYISLSDSIKRWVAMSPERDKIRQKCYEVIDARWNPHVQIQTFKNILSNSLC